jgi:SAM-dependent methyltransferase
MLSIDNLPSFVRFRYLFQKIGKISLSRALQNEVIEKYFFKGDLLDFGGGEISHNRSLIKCGSYKSINIDAKMKPTWVTDVNDPFPCSDGSFNHIFSFNTLEHIFAVNQKLSEFYRVLKPGGDILISTPFLYPIHGHPDDFYRFTPSWYDKALKMHGFRQIKVTPLFWGPFSSGLSSSGIPGPFKNFRKRVALAFDLFLMLYKKNLLKNEIEKKYSASATVLIAQAVK